MNIIPVIRCSDLERSLKFYTQVLDFVIEEPEDPDTQYILLWRDGARVDLSSHDGGLRSIVIIEVENVDILFKKYLERGLDITGKSGVHSECIDQTWGMREFYVDDPDNNTLRFGQVIK